MSTHREFNSTALGLWVFLASVTVQLLFLRAHPRLTYFEYDVVFGQPISDTERWHKLGADLANGRGLTGSFRAFYPMLLALVFVWTGPSVLAAKLVNVLLHSLSLGFASTIFARVFNLQAGLATAAFMLLDRQGLYFPHALFTEHAGLIFFVLSIYFLLDSFVSAPGGTRLVLSGIFLGLSNLARPLTLLSACVFVPYLALKSPGYARAKIRNSLLFALGFAACLIPWIARQKVTSDTYSISTNSMEAFWAATDPKWGTWSQAAIAEARKEKAPRSPAESETFFRDKALQNLRQNPVFYLKNVSFSFWKSLDSPVPPSGAVAVGLILVVTGILKTSARKSEALDRDSISPGANWIEVILSILVAVASMCRSSGALVLLGMGFCFFLKLPRVGILSGALFCTLLTNAAFALPLSRLNHLFDWLRLGFIVYGWQQTLIWFVFNLRKAANFSFVEGLLARSLTALSKWYGTYLANIPNRARQRTKTAAVVLVTLIAITAFSVVIRNVRATRVLPLERLTASKKREILLESMRRNPNLIAQSDIAEALDEKRAHIKRVEGRLIADVAELPYFGYGMYAGEEGPPEFPVFSNRSYDHMVLHVSSAIYGMRYLILPGKLPASLLKREAIVIARLHQLGSNTAQNFNQSPCFEMIALVPIDGADNRLRWDEQIVAEEASHRAILKGISDKRE